MSSSNNKWLQEWPGKPDCCALYTAGITIGELDELCLWLKHNSKYEIIVLSEEKYPLPLDAKIEVCQAIAQNRSVLAVLLHGALEGYDGLLTLIRILRTCPRRLNIMVAYIQMYEELKEIHKDI